MSSLSERLAALNRDKADGTGRLVPLEDTPRGRSPSCPEAARRRTR